MASSNSDDSFPWDDSGEDYDDEDYDEPITMRPSSNDDKTMKFVEDPSYSSHLSSGLYQLRQQASFSDVTIIVDAQRFPAHKAVLSCACDYFKNMFSSGFEESSSKEISIPGAPESFAMLLKFAYLGHFTLSATTAIGVLKMASYMLFIKAMRGCAKYLTDVIQQLSMGDCFEVWSVANQHKSLSAVSKLYHTHLMNNFPKLSESEVFLENATLDFLLESLGDYEIETDEHNEEQILQGTIKWLKHDWEKRTTHTVDLLKKIRLGLIPVNRLQEILDLDIPECKAMLDEVARLEASKESATVPLNRSRPDLFSPRSYVTAPLSLCGLHFNYRCDEGCYRLQKMQTIPHPDLADEDKQMEFLHVPSGSSSNFGFLVTGNGDLYVAGGPHSFQEGDDTDWPYRNNFFKYDVEQNSWITLPAMEIQHEPEIFESEGFIYSIGKAHDSMYKFKEEGYNIQRYNIASKKWKTLKVTLEETSVIGVVFIQGCLLVLRLDEDPDDPLMGRGAYRFGLYNTTIRKWSEVRWIKSPNTKRGREGPAIFLYKGNVYVIRYFKVKGSKPSIMKAHMKKLVCDFEHKKPTVTEAEEIDFKETFGIEVNEIDKENPRVNFTFDKRKLGVSKTHEYDCPCHDFEDDLSRFWPE